MKTFKTILLLVLVFVAGAVVGVVGTRAVVRHVVREAILHPQTLVERSLTRRLRLDNEQQVKIGRILTDARAQLKDLRQQYRPQLSEVFSNANDQINVILTPEQQARFDELKLKNRSFLQAMQ